jgi:hypothetical protein
MAKIADVQKGSKLVVKIGRDEHEITDPTLRTNILSAWDLTTSKKVNDEKLSPLKGFIAEAARNHGKDNQTITFIVDGVQCKITFGKEAKILAQNVDRIKALLPDSNIDDLVKSKVTFFPEKRLIELAAKNPELAELITVSDKAPAFEFTLIK